MFKFQLLKLVSLFLSLKCFYVSSGPKVNFHKSKVSGIEALENETKRWADMNLIKNGKPIIDKFHSKLSIWKAKTMSFGGQLTLVKTNLCNLPTGKCLMIQSSSSKRKDTQLMVEKLQIVVLLRRLSRNK